MIYSLTPFVQRTIWGGNKLAHFKKLLGSNELPVGETWEVSSHPAGRSLIEGRPLERPYEQLPYLVKLIDTGAALSVQVHPDDEYARKNENSSGKTECWIILESEPGAGIYLGLKEGITKQQFQAALESGSAMNEFLQFYEVRSGDYFFVPPGSIHAIGAGITLAEIQQNSGITYRVWDWNRVDQNGKSRELHIQKSLDVINFETAANLPAYFKQAHNLFKGDSKILLAEHTSFTVNLYNLKANESIKIDLDHKDRISSLLNFKSPIRVNSALVESLGAILIEGENSIIVESFSDCSFILVE